MEHDDIKFLVGCGGVAVRGDEDGDSDEDKADVGVLKLLILLLIISLEFKTGEKDRRCEFNELADGIRG
jgi:hypothetical protein